MKLSRSLFFFLSAVEAFLPHHHRAVVSRSGRSLRPLFMSTELSVDDITADAEERMGKSVESVKTNLLTIRTGRANANMLDRVKVEYYGRFLHRYIVGCRCKFG